MNEQNYIKTPEGKSYTILELYRESSAICIEELVNNKDESLGIVSEPVDTESQNLRRIIVPKVGSKFIEKHPEGSYAISGYKIGLINEPKTKYGSLVEFLLGRYDIFGNAYINYIHEAVAHVELMKASTLVYPLYDQKIIQQKFANAMAYMPPF